MSENKLTSKQQHWLEHIQKAERQEQSLSAYAQQHQLNLKLLYNMKHALRQKGVLAKPMTMMPALTFLHIHARSQGAQRLLLTCHASKLFMICLKMKSFVMKMGIRCIK